MNHAPLPTPEEVQILLDNIQALRKEAQNMDSNPVNVPEVQDYATAGNTLDLAIRHLNEGIPNGQLLRVSAAFALLREGTEQLGNWLEAKGFLVDPSKTATHVKDGDVLKVKGTYPDASYLTVGKR